MPFQKGKSGNPRGRPKGAPNKLTTDMRAVFKALVEGEFEDLRAALHEVRFGIEIEKQTEQGTVVGRLNADPKGYLETIGKLAEFCIPKLARTETGIADASDEELLAEIRRRREQAEKLEQSETSGTESVQ